MVCVLLLYKTLLVLTTKWLCTWDHTNLLTRTVTNTMHGFCYFVYHAEVADD